VPVQAMILQHFAWSGRSLLTPSEAANVGALKEASPSFVATRRLAMRFRGLLRGADPSKLDRFLMTPGDRDYAQRGSSRER